jgi:CBS domain-containing protein
MKTARDVLKNKGHLVVSVAPEATVYTALELMAQNEIGAVMVVEGEHPVGIVTERLYAREIILKGKASADTPVREIMTRDVVCVRPQQTVEECMALMTEKRVRHLPVLENDAMIGIVSIGDVVKAMISEREFVIDQLETYIKRG